MNLTHCPLCNTRVHSTHRCQGRPVPLVPMPTDFKDLFAQAKAEYDEAQQCAEQRALLDLPELDR